MHRSHHVCSQLGFNEKPKAAMTAVTLAVHQSSGHGSATRFHRHAFSKLKFDDATAERGRSIRQTTEVRTDSVHRHPLGTTPIL